AASLVLYACGVTDVDPLAYRLPFDRFLNLERYTMPDIGVDFMDSRRDEVIKYVMDKYGADRVAQIITFGTMGARAAISDGGRAMGLPYGDVDRIAKMIPGPTVTLKEAIDAEPELRETSERDPQIRRILNLAQKLEGVASHASTHAAGVIIARHPLIEQVPLQRATKGDLVMTQYDMNSVAAIGLLKMDFLGLTNLTILDAAIRIIRETRGAEIDLARIPLDDQPSYALLSSGETTGIFQLEGRGMRRYLKDLRPDRIEDVMAMVALFRPGPMANIPSYIRRKHGQEPVTYLHPLLEPVLKDTYGLIAYYTAYLKAHYPAEYMTAVLTSDAGDTEKVAQAVAECHRMDIRILPPDVNTSAASFTVEGEAIRFGLAAVRNVGPGAVES